MGGFLCLGARKIWRSEFQQLLRRFSKLKQTGTVLEYAEQFNLVMHSLLAHHGSWDPLFFTTQFLEGLTHEIKVAVMLHHPQDLEIAVALAELQEEVIEMMHQEHELVASYRTASTGARGGRYSARTTSAAPVTSHGDQDGWLTASTHAVGDETRAGYHQDCVKLNTFGR